MVSSPNSEWQPRWGFKGMPHDVVIFTTETRPRPAAATLHTEQICRVVANFLVRWLEDAPRSEEEANASFLYVVLNRSPATDENVLEIKNAGPLVEFGFGEAPAAPDEWDSTQVRELIRAAVRWLRC